MELKSYRCTVTLLVDDVPAAALRRMVGSKVEWISNSDSIGYTAMIEDVERVEEATDAL